MKTALGLLLIAGGVIALIAGVCGYALSEVQAPFIVVGLLGVGSIVGAVFILRTAK